MLLNFLGSPDTAWNDTLQFLIATLEFTITTTSCVGSIRRLNSQPFIYKLEAIPNPCSLDLKLIWLVTLHPAQDIYTIRFSNITRHSQCTIMIPYFATCVTCGLATRCQSQRITFRSYAASFRLKSFMLSLSWLAIDTYLQLKV